MRPTPPDVELSALSLVWRTVTTMAEGEQQLKKISVNGLWTIGPNGLGGRRDDRYCAMIAKVR